MDVRVKSEFLVPRGGYELIKTRAHPARTRATLAERAMPVMTGIIVNLVVSALAQKDIPSESLRFAIGNVTKDAPFLTVEPGEPHPPSCDVAQCCIPDGRMTITSYTPDRGLKITRRGPRALARSAHQYVSDSLDRLGQQQCRSAGTDHF